MAHAERPVMLQVRSLHTGRDHGFDSLSLRSSSGGSSSSSQAKVDSRVRPKELDHMHCRKRPFEAQSMVLPSPTLERAPTICNNYQEQYSSDKQGDRNSYSSTASTSSSASSTSSTSSSVDSDSPSLILPYLYVGNQAQTHVDTISNLDISYVLSLQSLPKFLDSDTTKTNETCSETGATVDTFKQSSTTKKLLEDVKDGDIKGDLVESGGEEENGEVVGGNETDKPSNGDRACKVLPLVNSSKDYLVKISSSVNRMIRGKCINISDTFETLVDKFFDETHNFIEEARKNRCNVLIHCKAGISRSPTIAIAYLMKWKRLHLHDAYSFVKRCRPQISPNLNFMGQLVSYERQLLQQCDGSQLPSPTANCLPIVDDNNESYKRLKQAKLCRQKALNKS